MMREMLRPLPRVFRRIVRRACGPARLLQWIEGALTLDELLQEGDALSRPCFLLREDRGDRLAGYWGGERKDMPSRLPPEAIKLAARRHIATFDPVLFAELGLHRVRDPISLFTTRRADGSDYLHV